MVSTRARATTTPPPSRRPGGWPADATPPPPSLLAATDGGGGGTQEYERRRDERIRENMERMQKLGIVDLALKFKSSISGRSSATSKAAYNRRATPSPLPLDLPPRRSSRLQNVTPVSYVEICAKRKEETSLRETGISLEGPIEEVYTEEHEKLLGTCENRWTLFVDGYSKDGVRIYDPVKGKTCHQCRQKTLGHRTHCSKCNLVQGQFCGDCLYMRYGENVLEAKKNPNWICPVCRGICNCSLCRTKKGWAPTGILYKKISSLGFKSVAHFLVQTKRGQTNIERIVSAHPISAQRSLPFTEEGQMISDCNGNNDDHCNRQIVLVDGNEDTDGSMHNLEDYGSISALETGRMSRKKLKKDAESRLIMKLNMDSVAGRLRNCKQLHNNDASNDTDGHGNSQMILLYPDSSGEKSTFCIVNGETQILDKCDSSSTLEGTGKPRKKRKKEMDSRLSVKPNPDSIAGRLRSHCFGYNVGDFNVEKVTLERSEKLDESGNEKVVNLASLPSICCITDVLRTHCIPNEDSGCKGRKNSIAKNSNKKFEKMHKGNNLALIVPPSLDCIAGRLRSRGSSYNKGSTWSIDEGTHSPVTNNNVVEANCRRMLGNRRRNRKELALIVIPSSDCIAGRLRSRTKYGVGNGEKDVALESGGKSGNRCNKDIGLAL